AAAAAHVPRQDSALAAPALVGALLEGLIGPLAPQSSADENEARAAVQTLTLLCLRALGVVDARARGLVVQTVLPAAEEALS
ncbi:MAG: TetR/AcrR family transcriptional regulator, partial [Pseudorhodoplanes sp.]|nr:TetR/AcrR family transcriptional regulator [Pseudorhodoplanes sp.]